MNEFAQQVIRTSIIHVIKILDFILLPSRIFIFNKLFL